VDIEIPGKCEKLNGLSLVDVHKITVDPESPFFVIDESFLKTFDKKVLIRYIGNDSHIIIGKEIEKISAGCFMMCKFPRTIIFRRESKLTIIEECAFQYSELKLIEIPASVEVIGEYALDLSDERCAIIFAAGSQLRDVHEYAFSGSIDMTMNLIGIHRGMNLDYFRDKALKIVYLDSDELREIFDSDQVYQRFQSDYAEYY
jgi:hypothetical protein